MLREQVVREQVKRSRGMPLNLAKLLYGDVHHLKEELKKMGINMLYSNTSATDAIGLDYNVTVVRLNRTNNELLILKFTDAGGDVEVYLIHNGTVVDIIRTDVLNLDVLTEYEIDPETLQVRKRQ